MGLLLQQLLSLFVNTLIFQTLPGNGLSIGEEAGGGTTDCIFIAGMVKGKAVGDGKAFEYTGECVIFGGRYKDIYYWLSALS